MRWQITSLCMVAIGVAGCSAAPSPWGPQPGPKVLAYFPPVYSLAASVAGDDAQVISLIKQVGPHHFDPSPRDARALKEADLFLTVGLGLDDSVSRKLTKTAGNAKLQQLVLGTLLPKESLREGGCEHCRRAGKEHAHEHGHDHEHTEYDPHVWLGIPEAIAMAQGISAELQKLDPAHAKDYEARAAALTKRLNALQDEGQKLLAAKQEKPRVLSFHDSLHYFARSFGIEVVDSIEAPGVEPSPKKLAQLVETCQKNNVRLIAVEPQYPTNTAAKTLMEELKRHGIEAAFVEIDPLETADAADLGPDYYERTVRRNLNNLAKALR